METRKMQEDLTLDSSLSFVAQFGYFIKKISTITHEDKKKKQLEGW